MSVIAGQTETWPDEVIQLLDDQHLVVVTDRAASGERFGDALIRRLNQMGETQVIVLDGEAVTDVPSFCRLVELQTLSRTLLGSKPCSSKMSSSLPAPAAFSHDVGTYRRVCGPTARPSAVALK